MSYRGRFFSCVVFVLRVFDLLTPPVVLPPEAVFPVSLEVAVLRGVPTDPRLLAGTELSLSLTRSVMRVSSAAMRVNSSDIFDTCMTSVASMALDRRCDGIVNLRMIKVQLIMNQIRQFIANFRLAELHNYSMRTRRATAIVHA